MVILLTNVVKLSSFVEKPCWNLPGKGKVQNVNSRMLNGWCWRCGYKWPVAVCVGFFLTLFCGFAGWRIPFLATLWMEFQRSLLRRVKSRMTQRLKVQIT